MNNIENPEQHLLGNQISETNLELSKKPEGKEIQEKLEKEYDRRVIILKSVLIALEIPEDLVILAPPVLNRTDFGYTSDIDFAFLGNDEQELELCSKLQNTFEVFPFVVKYDSSRLEEIKNDFPIFYEFLMQRKGNILTKGTKTEISPSNFWDEASELEAGARAILSPDEKLELKRQRLAIGKNFVGEVEEQIPVLGYTFSGSMMNDMNRFGINSDLDIEILTNPASKKDEMVAIDWIHVYLKWKYAEKFGIKIDIGDVSLEFARKMASRNPEFVEFYKKEFGIDIIHI